MLDRFLHTIGVKRDSTKTLYDEDTRKRVPRPEVTRDPNDPLEDRDSIRMYFPHSKQYIRYNFKFPSTEAHEKFLCSPRTLEDVEKFGGHVRIADSRLTKHFPPELLNVPENDIPGIPALIFEIADDLGISVTELEVAQGLALSTFVANYQVPK